MYYGYEYFCGANVCLEIEGQPILETAGLNVRIAESKIPIYGYSSRFFDAVARGQVLVQGSIVINYVDHDYLYHAIRLGLEDGGFIEKPTNNQSNEMSSILNNQVESRHIFNILGTEDFQRNQATFEAFKDKYWTNPIPPVDFVSPLPNAHDAFGGLDLKVTFGERSVNNSYNGRTGYLISEVHFTGSSQVIQISEEVIVEEFQFFARNIYGLVEKYKVVTSSEQDNIDLTQTIVPIRR